MQNTTPDKNTADAPASVPAKTPASTVPSPPRWLTIFAHLVMLIYPLALIGSAVALYCVFGPCGWLWLVLMLVIVLAIFARPKFPTDADEK